MMENVDTDACVLQSDIRMKLKDLSDCLGRKEVDKMKFLCVDFIPKIHLERVKQGFQLMEQMLLRNEISHGDLTLLAEIFYKIGRYDLLRKIGWSSNSVDRHLAEERSQCKLLTNRIILHDLAEEMTSEDLDSLKFYIQDHHLPRARITNASSPQELFLLLEEFNVISSNNFSYLAGIFRSMQRTDLLEILGISPGGSIENWSSSSQSPVLSYPPPSSEITSSGGASGDSLSTTSGLSSPVEDAIPASHGSLSRGNPPHRRRTHRAPACPAPPPASEPMQLPAYQPPPPAQIDQQAIQQAVQQFLLSYPISPNPLHPAGYPDIPPGSEDLPKYKMDARPVGVCLIINNKAFYRIRDDPLSRGLKNREGTDVDCARMKEVFSNLDFIVNICDNLTDEGFFRVLTDHAQRVDHSTFDCFVCCILTHGDEGRLYGTNGKAVVIRDLLSLFKGASAATLRGKPKLFFIQACQGRDTHPAVDVDCDDATVETDDPPVQLELSRETLPDEADMLVGYASVPGYVSFRSRVDGSWYITALYHNLMKYAYKHDLLSILTKVNEDVSAGTYRNTQKQCPAPLHTLRKKIYFYRHLPMVPSSGPS